MTVKTITITQNAYNVLFGLKHEGESFSNVILRIGDKKATTTDWRGICKNTEEEAEARLKEAEELRKKISNQIREKIKHARS